MSKKKENVLICVAHRDDETLGCGGIIQRHFLNKDNVYCCSMTDGVSSRSEKDLDLKKKKELAILLKHQKF